MSRPTWREYFLDLAKTASTRAACTRSQVGAVIVTRNNRILSLGYNGAPAGEPHCTEGACPRGRHWGPRPCTGHPKGVSVHVDRCGGCGEPWPCADTVTPLSSYTEGPGMCPNPHAERNAVDAMDWWRDLLRGCTIYITREPCNDCQELLRSHGLVKAVWPDGELIL